MTAPLAIDLYCGLGGWTEGLMSEGFDVIGETMQALVLIDRIERHASAARWTGSAGVHANLDLIG